MTGASASIGDPYSFLTGSGGGGMIRIGNASIPPQSGQVPEPSAVVLFSMVISGLFWARMRRGRRLE